MGADPPLHADGGCWKCPRWVPLCCPHARGAGVKEVSGTCPQQIVRGCFLLLLSCHVFSLITALWAQALGSPPAPLPSAPPVQPGYRQPGGEAGRLLTAIQLQIWLLASHIKQPNGFTELSQTWGCHNASKKGSQTRRGMGEGSLLPSFCECTLVEVSKEPGHMQSP